MLLSSEEIRAVWPCPQRHQEYSRIDL